MSNPVRSALFVAVVVAAVSIVLSSLSSAVGAPPSPPPTGRPTKITVYELPNYKGRKLEFERSVPSLAALQFNDQVASVQIKGPRDWVLCEHRNFMGRCGRIRAKAPNLKRIKLEGLVSSLYPVADPPPKPKKPS